VPFLHQLHVPSHPPGLPQFISWPSFSDLGLLVYLVCNCVWSGSACRNIGSWLLVRWVLARSIGTFNSRE
jgi:hypothetical protein